MHKFQKYNVEQIARYKMKQYDVIYTVVKDNQINTIYCLRM